jgi:hypothetical protein
MSSELRAELHAHGAEEPANGDRSAGETRAQLIRQMGADMRRWSLGFVAIAALVGVDAGEDVIDLIHSIWASNASMRIAQTLQPSGRHIVLLPREAMERAQTLFRRSLAYFWCDLIFIAIQRARGISPHLWVGRIAHHAIQTAANVPVIFSSGRRRRIMSTYLSLAYMAELSSICLRLSRLLKRLRGRRALDGRVLRGLTELNHRALLLLFALFRLVNFPLCGRLIWSNRSELGPATVRCHLGFASASYTMNCVWFVKLLLRRPGGGA